MWLTGKNIVITGASDGIGLETAVMLSSVCSRLLLVATNRSGKLDELRRRIRNSPTVTSVFESADIRDVPRMQKIIDLFSKKGSIDAFVHCAGGTNFYGEFQNCDYDTIDEVIDINIKGTLYWLRCLLPIMIQNDASRIKRGHVVLLSSRSAERSLPNLCPYTVSKGAVDKIADALQKEYARHHIAFTLLNPGSVKTSFTSQWANRDAADAHNEESMEAKDVADFIIYSLNCEHVINRISMESVAQWAGEPGTLK